MDRSPAPFSPPGFAVPLAVKKRQAAGYSSNPWGVPLQPQPNARNGLGDTSIFSTSLPVLPHEKLISPDSAYGTPSMDDTSAKLKDSDDDPLGNDYKFDFDLWQIDNLLPDEDDLFAGITNEIELEEFDVFGSGGGMELDSDPMNSITAGLGNTSIGDGLRGNGVNNFGLSNSPGAVAGDHPFGEHPSRTLFVRNINSNVEDSELRSLFEQFGDIRTLYTATKHRGFVMISYFDIRAARGAMRSLQNKPLRRRKLDIHFFIPKENPSDKDLNQGTLIIFNLDPSVSNEEVRQIFGVYGEVKEIRETPNKKHHKFIEFYDLRAVKAALSSLNKSEIAGKRIKLEPSRPGGTCRSLVQSLGHELEQDDSRSYRPHIGSPIANSPPGFRSVAMMQQRPPSQPQPGRGEDAPPQASADEVRTLWIGDLQYWMDENYIYGCFASTAEVQAVKLIRDKITGQLQGYGFVEFASHAAAERALQTYNGQAMPDVEMAYRLKWASFGEKRDDTPDCSIFVGDLAADVTDYMLQETFRVHYPSVKVAKVVTDKMTMRSKGYGFVKFGDPAEQARAVTEMNGMPCSSRPMRISPEVNIKTTRVQERGKISQFPSGRTPADLASENGHNWIAGFLAKSSLTRRRKSITQYPEARAQYSRLQTCVRKLLKYKEKMVAMNSLWLPAAEMDIPITAWIDTAMEGPVTALLGPMAPLLRQVHYLSAMAPEHMEGDVKRLKEHLEVLCRDLVEPEETSLVPKWWRKEVRELLYDTEDRLHEVIIFQAGDFSELVAGVDDACERRKRLQLAPNKTTSPDLGEAGLSYFTPQRTSIELSKPISVQGHYGSLGVVGIEDPMNKLVEQLAFDDDKQKRLKVIPIVGFPGVGKTTVARILYYMYREKFHCSAFVRVSQTPDTRSLLISILSQIKAPGLCGFPDVHDLIDGIRKHLKGKRYFIIMDDLWTASIWDIVSRCFPDADYGSRIIPTTQIDDVALACCRYYPDYIEISPLNDDQSKELFFTRVFGSEDHCPPDFKKVSCKIINKCAGLPLAIVSIASMLATESFLIVEKWEHIQDSLPCTRTNPTSKGVKSLSSDTASGSAGKMLARGPKIEKWNRTRDSLSFTSEGLKQVLNVVYNNLPPHLKACLLYLCMYPAGYLVRKHDLVRQWVAEDFVNAMGGRGAEETAGVYFDELVSRGMVQPAATNCGNEVLSCTVHHMILDLIRHKSKELNFIIIVDNLQSTLAFPDEVRRLSVQFGGSKGADVPEFILISKVRSLLFWGFFECVPSVVDYALLRVLILHIWADGDETSFDLTSISELLLLRYLKIQCNIMVNLPDEIKGLKCLETLEVDARLSSVPWDIGHLKKLSHLLLPSEAILPKGLDGLTSLLTLGCFDLTKNPTQNVIDLAELTNLQDVHLTCSTEPSELPIWSMKHLGLILEKFNDLRSLTLHGAGSSSQIISDDGLSIVSPSPVLLEKLELLPRICTLSRLPKWMGELSRLSILKIEVLDLSINDIAILKELASLASLSLSVRTEHAEWIIFDSEAFPVLKYFKFVRIAPYMSFLEGAMHNVQKLKLAFNVNRLKPEYSPWACGFQYMTSLKQVSVKFGGAGADDSNKRDAEHAWKDAFTNHPNNPILDARWVDCIFNGDKTTDVGDTKA